MIRSFHDLKLNQRFLVLSLAIFVVAGILSGIIYFLVKQTIRENITSELQNTTATILSMVTTATDVSIKNYLRAAAAKNKEIVKHVYDQQMSGELTTSQAKTKARELLLSQGIGKTGYIYCLDSRGTAVVHPHEEVQGRNFSSRGFIQQQIESKKGYLEYDWRNPGEAESKPKALYMSYFRPWDWIISVTSYRSEFTELIQVDDFRDRILSLRFGESGYCYIIDSQGNIVVHPELDGNLYEARDVTGRRFVQEMCRTKQGMLTYYWKNPGDPEARRKLVLYDYIPELDWIVASSSYMSEIYAPLDKIGFLILVLLGGFLLLILSVTYWLRRWVTTPLGSLMEGMAVAADGDLSVRMQPRSRDEIGDLARYFNSFMDRLLKSRRALRSEIKERWLAETRYRAIFDNADWGIFRISSDGVLTEANAALASLFGYSSVEECLQRPERVYQTLFGSSEGESGIWQRLRQNRQPLTFEKGLTGEDDRAASVLVHMRLVLDLAQGEEHLEGFVQDITELKRAEEERRSLERQLSQSQKLEAVGTLAGGIAHEFNNILQAIFGNVQLLLAKVSRDSEEYKYILKLDKSSRRAGELVRHLLTFGHKSEPKYELVCLNESVAYSLDLLKRTLPKSVIPKTDLQEPLPAVYADPFQIEQVLVNLVKNAADAMPAGGTITIRTEDILLAPEDPLVALGFKPGRYVRLEVTDPGQGMDEATREKIFDPFFTTKEVGKGTGLGLSMVYKMVTSMQGHISVSSALGEGTSVAILLPAQERAAAEKSWETEQQEGQAGEEAVLVIDDEAPLLDVAREALESQGYAVETAESSEEALRLLCEENFFADLIILDLGMPGMGGQEFLKALRDRQLGQQVIVSSGYSIEDVDFDFESYGVDAFLNKPYTLKELLSAVRQTLDGNSQRSGPC